MKNAMRFSEVTHKIQPLITLAAMFAAFTLILPKAEAQEGESTPLSISTQAAPSPVEQVNKIETHRLRLVNRADGAIQVSTDKGKTWRLIGRVLAPARTCAEGYLASQYAVPGTVAATAVHGLRIRTGGENANVHAPFVLTVEPWEYSKRSGAAGLDKANKGFGGYVSGAAGIFTDIPAGTSLFRDLAPLVGNPVYLERNGNLSPLPLNFTPTGDGDTLVIVVFAPENSLVSLTMENRGGGAVEGTFADGTTKQLCAVVQPVQGVGRFDGTAYTGVGRINTAHTGVITVSTAPIDTTRNEGEGKEQRGGFQIAPAWHNAHTEEAGSPMFMTLGPPGPRRKLLEGRAPLFSDAIGLDDAASARVEVSIDDGPWEPMPQVVGAQRFAFTGPGLTDWFRLQGIKRNCVKGVTGFHFTFPKRLPSRATAQAVLAVNAYKASRLAAARAGKIPLVSGLLTVNANPTNDQNVAFVRLSVEGTPRGFTNVAPFTLVWDTTRVMDGEYLLEAQAMDTSGNILATTRRRVYVQNRDTSAPRRVSSADGR